MRVSDVGYDSRLVEKLISEALKCEQVLLAEEDVSTLARQDNRAAASLICGLFDHRPVVVAGVKFLSRTFIHLCELWGSFAEQSNKRISMMRLEGLPAQLWIDEVTTTGRNKAALDRR
jgi:hypothetical protein